MSIVAINARNQIKGKIKEIVPGPVLSEVDVETPVGIITYLGDHHTFYPRLGTADGIGGAK